MRDRYGVDGVMIGRASIGNPWIFTQIKSYLKGALIPHASIEERVEICRIHLQKIHRVERQHAGDIRNAQALR